MTRHHRSRPPNPRDVAAAQEYLEGRGVDLSGMTDQQIVDARAAAHAPTVNDRSRKRGNAVGMEDGARDLVVTIAGLDPAPLAQLRADLRAYARERDNDWQKELEHKIGAAVGLPSSPGTAEKVRIAFLVATGLEP